jgi:hypothetical protein
MSNQLAKKQVNGAKAGLAKKTTNTSSKDKLSAFVTKVEKPPIMVFDQST